MNNIHNVNTHDRTVLKPTSPSNNTSKSDAKANTTQTRVELDSRQQLEKLSQVVANSSSESQQLESIKQEVQNGNYSLDTAKLADKLHSLINK